MPPLPKKTSSEAISSLIIAASFDNETSMKEYVTKNDALEAAEEETGDTRKIESGGYKADINKAKKNIRNSKTDIFQRAKTIGGFKALEELSKNELKKTQGQILVADALSIVSAIENEDAARSKKENLERIKNTFNSWVTAFTPGAFKTRDIQEIKTYVAQLKKEVDELKKLEATDPRKDALEDYIRAISTTATLTAAQINEAANSIQTNGYIADATLRNAIVVELEKLLNKYGQNLTSHAAHEKALVNALIDTEILYHTDEKFSASSKIEYLEDFTKLEIDKAKEIAVQQKIILNAQEKILEAKEKLDKAEIDKTEYDRIFNDEENNKEEASEELNKLITTALLTTTGATTTAATTTGATITPSPWSINIIERAKKAQKLVSIVENKMKQVSEIIDSIYSDQEIDDTDLQTEANFIFGSNYNASQKKVTIGSAYTKKDATQEAENKIAELISIRSQILAGKAIPPQEQTLAKRVFLDYYDYADIETRIMSNIPIENHLNGSDYELFIEMLDNKDNQEYLKSKNDASKKQITSLEQRREGLSQQLLEAAPTKQRRGQIESQIEVVENNIAEQYKESEGLHGEIQYLKSLEKKESRVVQIRNLESALSNEERRKEKAEKIVTDNEKKLPITERKLKLANKEVDELVTKAEKENDREKALEVREKAISKQRELFGERGVQELATRWEDKVKKAAEEKMSLYHELSAKLNLIVEELKDGSPFRLGNNNMTVADARTATLAQIQIDGAAAAMAAVRAANGNIAINEADARTATLAQIEIDGAGGDLLAAEEVIQKRNTALGGGDIAHAQAVDEEFQRIAREVDARNTALGGGGDIAHAQAIYNKDLTRIIFENALNDPKLKDKIVEDLFISGGYEAVEGFYNSISDATAKNDAQTKKDTAVFLVATLESELYTKESDKKFLENEIYNLQKKLDETQDKLRQAAGDGSDVSVLEAEYDASINKKEDADFELQTLKTEIDSLKSDLTRNVMRVGGQKLLAERAEQQIKALSLYIASKEFEESTKLQEASEAKKAAEAFQDGIDEKLNKYIIKIDDFSSKQPETYSFDRGVTPEKSRSIPPEEAKFINLASKVTASLFDLNDDNNPEMDLVPELRDSAGIQAKPKSESVKIYVAFNDPKKAAAFCSKMNNFKDTNSNNKINAGFVTGFDEYGQPKIAEQGKDEWKRYKTPKLEDENNEFDKKYVVSFEVGHYMNLPTFNFADEILKSEKANKVTSRAEDARLAERIREEKDEPIKTVIAFSTNLGGVTPLVASVAAIAMDVLVTSPLKFFRLPGSSVVSTANQAMYDYAAFATKRGNVLSFFSPDTAKKFGTSLENSSKKLLKEEEKNTAKGIRPFRDDGSPNTHCINNGFNAIVIAGTGSLSLCSKLFSLGGHFVGDASFKFTKMCTDEASENWSQTKLFPCGVALLGAAAGMVIGTTFRGLGIGFGGIGEALSKPAKAAYPKDSVKENRNSINQKIWGNLIHKTDLTSNKLRNYWFTPEEKSELKIQTTTSAPRMTHDEIKDSKADTKTKFDEVIRKFAIDIERPKFNKSSLIKSEKNEYIKIAELNFNNSTYIVSLGANNTVAVAEVGAVNDHSAANNLPQSLQGKISDFSKALFYSLAEKRETTTLASTIDKESPPSTLREFGLKFGGISTASATTPPAPGELLKSYLGDKYIVNTVHNVDVPDVGKYSVKVDGDNNIYIGKVGQDLEVIKEGEAAKNVALSQVVFSFGKKPTTTESPSTSFYTKPQERGALELRGNVKRGIINNQRSGGDGSSGRLLRAEAGTRL